MEREGWKEGEGASRKTQEESRYEYVKESKQHTEAMQPPTHNTVEYH